MVQRTRGVAYDFWLRLEQIRVQRELTKADLHERSGIARTTIDNLRTSTRTPQARVVHALADAVGMDRDDAARLAGLLPAADRPDGDSTVRDAIAGSTVYTDQQKAALLAMVDALDAANRATAGNGSAQRSDQAM